MFVRRLIHKAVSDLPIPPGNLKESQLRPQLAVHHGIPHTATILAYEPVQRLLAVSSSDGRTKILGTVGVEGLLQSATQFPCKYVEFLNNRGFLVHVNTQYDIEVWDVERRELVYFQKWEAEITSFNVLQGSPFMFLGDQTGAVFILEFVDHDHQLNIMPYVIPAHITLGGLVRAGNSDTPFVTGVLPQPDVFFTRLLVAYRNGLIILWGLHETQVLAVRGGTEDQRLQLSNFSASLKGRATAAPSKHHEATDEDDEEEIKEICCVCWACPVGSVLAAGYTDGEILFWSFPTIIKGKGQRETEFVEGPVYSGEPIHQVDLAPGKAKMPVVRLIWGASDPSSRGIGGRLYVFGGREVGQAEVLVILSLDSLNGQESGAKLLQVELNLQGPFADMALLPAPGGSVTTPAAALVLLTMPGLVHVFDELRTANYFAALVEGTSSPPSPEPVRLQLPVTESKVTCARLVLVSNDGMAAKLLLQLPQDTSSVMPSTLPAGTKWPISGGALSATSSGRLGEENLYITGHDSGIVKFWDASSHVYSLLCTVESQSELAASGKSSVTTLEFCLMSGLLAVGSENGMFFVYKLSKEAHQVKCSILEVSSAVKEELLDCAPGFGCILVQNVHKAPISAISIASGPSRMAVGDVRGMVSLLDLKSRSVTFYDCCFPNNPSPILALAFSTELLSEDSTPTSPRSPRSPRLSQSRSKGKHNPLTVGHRTVLYVVGKDATMVAIDGNTGGVFGSGAMHPKNPSTAVSLHLLDAGGAPVGLLDRQLAETFQPGDLADQVELANTSTSSVQEDSLQRTSHEEQSSDAPTCGTSSEALYLLLCCTDSLRLYATDAVIQGQRTTLCKVKLDITCCWTSTFFNEDSKDSGLILMSSAGDIEFRSLPDLGLLKQTSLTTVLGWKVEPTMHSQKTVACNVNGELVVADHDSELIHMYVLEQNSARDQVALPRLYDKDLAKAADAAITYATTVSNKKSQTPIQGMQGLLGGVLKELKNVLDIEQHGLVHVASELPKLFTSCPFTVAPVEPKTPAAHHEASGSSPSPPGTAMEIDDIDVDYTEPESPELPQQHPVEVSKGKKFANRFTGAIKSLKGKERSSDESNRIELFDGKDEPKLSKAQRVDDIRAKYGHPRKSQEISSALDQARNKLAERGEKLQDISDKTAEMEDNAQNFASMAEELAKKMARKKWWEL